jgi:hypothetical protein
MSKFDTVLTAWLRGRRSCWLLWYLHLDKNRNQKREVGREGQASRRECGMQARSPKCSSRPWPHYAIRSLA